MNKISSLGTVFIFLLANSVNAAVDIPRRLTGGRSDFSTHAFGDNCFSMDVQWGLPCNPAFLARDRKQFHYGHVFLGNSVGYYNDAREVLDNRADTETFQRLFSQTQSGDVEADVDLGRRDDEFALSFSPSRLNFYSLIRDRVLPYITLYASQEQVLRLQYAWQLPNHFYLGVQGRALSRKFIFSNFFLTEAIAEGGADRVANARYQNLLYFEPGILWSDPEIALKPQVSFTVTQLAVADKLYDEIPSSAEAEMGASIKPELESGVLEFGAHVSLHRQIKQWTELLGAAASYRQGMLGCMGSVRENQAALGISLELSKFQGGLVYDYEIFENLLGERDQRHTWYFQLGAEI